MKTLKKISLFLSFAILATTASFALNTDKTAAADTKWTGTATGYTQASDVSYKKTGKYVHNWGARDEECVFLTSYADNFYSTTYSFDNLSTKAGSSTISNVPSSTLYKSLQNLMSSKQSYQTSYDATKSLFCYTDCVNGNSSYISSFYSAKKISGLWDGSWNREHTWPNSKGDLSGNGENDIMMLRPTWTKENSSRGNTAYGEGSGYYNPNGEGQDLRGDCARIVLYVYVRWGCINTGSKYNSKDIFGQKGVIQSLDVLLDWMEEDPVDTWEMGRNDAVQSITGTRNVFVDYPEYAWLMFGRDIPKDMCTPSGIASGGTYVPTPMPDDSSSSGSSGSSGSSNSSNSSSNPGSPDDDTPTAITAPVQGVAYNMYLNQANLNKTLYLTGKMDATNSKFYGMTTDLSKAADVYAEAVSGGYKFYILDENNAKSYLTLTEYKKDGKNYYGASVSFSADGTVFHYESVGCWAATLANDTFFLGTYNSFETASASSSYYMDESKMGTEQFPLMLTLADTDNPFPDDSSSSIEDSSSSIEDSSSSIEDSSSSVEDSSSSVEDSSSSIEDSSSSIEDSSSIIPDDSSSSVDDASSSVAESSSEDDSESGCNSSVGMSLAAIILAAGVILAVKKAKKED